ncbi:MAG TPA: GAF domain-containing protein, partial [Trichocoleus sp.]
MEDLDLLIREVITVGPETSLKEAATLMADRLKTAVDWAEASCVCVEAGAVIGVITQANIVALVAAQHEWSTLRVSDLLRNQIGCDRTLHQDSGLLQVETAESLALLGQWFRQQRVSVLPVVDQAQHLVGLLTQDRLLQAFIQTVQSSQSAAQSPTVGAAQPESALLHSTQEHLASPTAELKQRIAAGTLLETITTHLHGSFQLEVPLQEVVIELHQFSKADRVLIYQFQADWSGQVVAEAVSPGWDGLLGQEITDPHFAEHRLEAYRQGHIQVTNDVLASGFSPCHLDLLRRLQVQALVVVPILWNDHLWGLLILQECAGPRAWNPFEVSLVQRVADHIAIALQQAARYRQSHQELQAHRQQEAHLLWHSQATELLASLAQKALQATDLNPLLDEVTQRVAQTLDLKFCGVLELLPNRAALLLRAGVGWPQNWIRQATVRADQRSQYGYTLAHHQPIAVRDLRLETRFSDTPFLHNLNIVSGVSTLIQGKNGPYGILSVHVHEQRDFSEAEITLMQSVADILAAVVKRHQTEEELAHFFELSLDLFCIASSEGLVQRVNARFETLLSYPEGALVGEPLVDIVHPEDRKATQEALYRLATGAPTVQFENRCHCCDDSYRWISWSVTLTGTGEKLF